MGAYTTLDELAERWHKSTRTLRRYMDDGLPGTREPFLYTRIGPSVLFTDKQVATMERSLERASAPPRPGRRRRSDHSGPRR